MFALKCSLLNRLVCLSKCSEGFGYNLFICSPQVIFLSNITPRYFTLFTNGMVCPFIVRKDSGGLIL
jgi:hypothetical protein